MSKVAWYQTHFFRKKWLKDINNGWVITESQLNTAELDILKWIKSGYCSFNLQHYLLLERLTIVGKKEKITKNCQRRTRNFCKRTWFPQKWLWLPKMDLFKKKPTMKGNLLIPWSKFWRVFKTFFWLDFLKSK